jgi:hypothetical protein
MMNWPRRSASAITPICDDLVILNVITVTRRPRDVTRIAGLRYDPQRNSRLAGPSPAL